MTTDRTFALAMQVEDEAREIYELLARGVSTPSQRELFRRLAAEETQHWLRIDMLRHHCRNTRSTPDLALDHTKIEELLRDATALKRLLEQSPSFDDEELTRLVSTLEDRFAVVHAETAAQTVDEPIRELFLQLSQQDQAHGEVLRQGLGRRAN